MPVVIKQSGQPSKTVGQQKGAKGGGVLSRISPIGKVVKKDAINIYGVSGTGKTTLACTYPKPLLLIGFEDGTRSVQDVDGVDFILVENTGELVDIFSFLREGRYASAVLDTTSSLQSMTLKEILGLEELPTQRSWGMASRDQYGQSALQTKEILRHFLRLSKDNVCHTVMLAQERDFEGEGSQTYGLISPKVMSSLTASVVGWMNPECDYICQTYIRMKLIEKVVTVNGKKKTQIEKHPSQVEYCLRTRPHEVYTIKFRTPRGHELPECIVDPSYEKIHAVIGDL